MNVNPLDLQVLFSKASEYSASLGKQSSVHDAEDFVANDLQTRQSKETTEEVNKADAYDEEFTNINEQTKGNSSEEESDSEKREAKPEENHNGLKEEGTGLIIDIID